MFVVSHLNINEFHFDPCDQCFSIFVSVVVVVLITVVIVRVVHACHQVQEFDELLGLGDALLAFEDVPDGIPAVERG